MKSHKDVKTNRCSTVRFFEELIIMFRDETEMRCAKVFGPGLAQIPFHTRTASWPRHFFRLHDFVEFFLREISKFQSGGAQA
jgi:hypothetical protein